MTQQQPQVRPMEPRHVEPRLIAPPVTVHSAPATFVSPQRMPQQHPMSSLPQQAAQVITVAGPTMTYPTQPAPQLQVYTPMQPSQSGVSLHQPTVFSVQPNFPSQNFVSQPLQQQPQGVNVMRSATVQPMYRNVEPLTPQQPQFLLPTPPVGQQQHPPGQPMVYQRLMTPASGDRPSFDGNTIRTPASSLQSPLPGYVDFGRGEGNQLHFRTDFYSDPEIVGQPIETVIHSRKGPEWLDDRRAPVGFRQNRLKQFPGVR